MNSKLRPETWLAKLAIDCFDQISTTNNKVKSKDCSPEGLYPVIDQGQNYISGYINDESKIIKVGSPICVFGDHTRIIKWVAHDFVPGADGTKLLRPKTFIHPRYAYYSLCALNIPDKGYSRHFKYFKELEINLPGWLEQKIIAEKLDTLLAQVDSTKASLEQIPQILKQFRQALLAAAVNGKLTKELHETNRFKQTELSISIPSSWKISEIGQFADVKGGKRLPKGESLITKNSGFPYIRAGQLKNGTVIPEGQLYLEEHTQKSISRYTVSSGDLYITIVGACIGDTGIIPEEYNNANLTENAAKICNLKEDVSNKFLSLWLRSSYLQDIINSEIKSGAQGKLALARIKSLPLLLPSLHEQAEIVRRVEQLFAYADTIEKQVNNALTLVNNLTQSILAKAFRGELTAQWRAENPELISGKNSAAALLEKIKAERTASGGKKPSNKKS